MNKLIDLQERELNKDTYNPLNMKNTSLDNLKNKNTIDLAEANNIEVNIDKLKEKESKYNERDIGINSPSSEAFLKIKETGDIELFTNSQTGLRMQNLNNTIGINTDQFNLNSKKINIKCDDMGLKINDFTLNPLIYKLCNNDLNPEEYRDLRLNGTVRIWNNSTMEQGWMREDIAFKPFFPNKLAEEIKEFDKLINWSLDD